MQIAAIPTGPSYYQPVAPAPAVRPVAARAEDEMDASQKLRAAQPAGIGRLLDIEA